MEDKFLIGVLLGMVGGALLTTNSVKARQMVKDSQQQVIQKASELTKQTEKKN